MGSQLSLGIDDHGAVVGAFLTALGVDTAAVQPHIQFFGQRGEALEGRSTGDRFCNVPDSGSHIIDALRHTDELSALGGSPADQFFRSGQIGLHIVLGIQLDHAGKKFVHKRSSFL